MINYSNKIPIFILIFLIWNILVLEYEYPSLEKAYNSLLKITKSPIYILSIPCLPLSLHILILCAFAKYTPESRRSAIKCREYINIFYLIALSIGVLCAQFIFKLMFLYKKNSNIKITAFGDYRNIDKLLSSTSLLIHIFLTTPIIYSILLIIYEYKEIKRISNIGNYKYLFYYMIPIFSGLIYFIVSLLYVTKKMHAILSFNPFCISLLSSSISILLYSTYTDTDPLKKRLC
ncbi:hypothetical protein TCON_1515 [Astathelohania contejeani]|uniref:Uncharacterized protein n=1 Tax=Astathelohania contejeani TaxID=164912 RepID=A0ABQ7HYJ1_9MICR|nr:hypothetical protein TCON_1515 [Thelohania contejeani]